VPAARLPLACSAVAAALLLSACGGGSGSTTPPPPRESAKTTPGERFSRTREGAGGKSHRKRHKPAASSLCQSQLGGFLGSMDSLRRRLAVGVTYEQYVDEIHAVGSTYRDAPVDRLQLDCVGAVGVPAEHAFNRYIEAANQWGECVSKAGCGSPEIEPVLQQGWRVASHFLSEAEDGLRRIEA
jgi:hypothetical protein